MWLYYDGIGVLRGKIMEFGENIQQYDYHRSHEFGQFIFKTHCFITVGKEAINRLNTMCLGLQVFISSNTLSRHGTKKHILQNTQIEIPQL